MRMEDCGHGHFYDADKYSSCPHCSTRGVAKNDFTVPEAVKMDVTIGEDSAWNWGETQSEDSGGTATKTESSLSEQVSSVQNDDEKTIGVFDEIGQPVVGWLVCIEGEHFGKDFKLKTGGNFIGRSADMDVALTGDSTVSRSKHAVLIYEPKNNIFIIQPGESKGLSYLNDKVVLTPTELNSNDVIQVGNTKLIFIPLCTDRFKWDDVKNEEE